MYCIAKIIMFGITALLFSQVSFVLPLGIIALLIDRKATGQQQPPPHGDVNRQQKHLTLCSWLRYTDKRYISDLRSDQIREERRGDLNLIIHAKRIKLSCRLS